MKTLVLAVGTLKEAHYRAAEAEYRKRLARFCEFEVREVKNDEALVKALPKTRILCVLDERGDNLSSRELAEFFAHQHSHGGGRTLVFALGGAEGLGERVRTLAAKTLAFGRITLPHRLARIVLIEQIYRAHTLLANTPYHK